MKRFFRTCAAASLAIATLAGGTASAQEKYLGEIIWVGFNFCPRGSLPADGQLLPIAQNTALFSLFGTMYGGDGRTTFAVPDLRGRVSISVGQAPGLSPRRQGERGGTETETVMPAQIPVPAEAKQAATAAIGGQPQNNMPPYLAMRACVISEGIYPSRS